MNGNNNNWKVGGPPVGDNNPMMMMDNGGAEWRKYLHNDSRPRVVNKIMETLKKHHLIGLDGLQELKKIAVRFEEKIYFAATSQSDYLQKISLKMLTLETKSQNTGAPNPNIPGSSQNSLDPVSHGMQAQVWNQGPPVPLPNQSQGRQQLLAAIQNTNAPTKVQSASGLTSTLPSVTGLSQPTMPNTIGLQGVSGISQSLVSNNSMGQQGMPSNLLTSLQRQLQGRQHPQQVVPEQHQQQPSNQQQYLYNQQMQLMKQKIQQGNAQPSPIQSNNQQHPTQLQSSQQPRVQLSSGGIQPSKSTHQQMQTLIQPSSQQASVIRQQQSQQNQLVGQQQSNGTNIQNHLTGQQKTVLDLQQQQQPQSLNNLSNMQQQQLMGQQNNISNLQQQQLGTQNNVGGNGFQQQQQQQQQQHNILGVQPGVSGTVGNLGFDKNTQQCQQPIHMPQQQSKGAGLAPLISSNLLQPLQGRHQPQSQMGSQPSQIQQQLGSQQLSNSLQRDMQQRLLIQFRNGIDQKPIFQSQRALSEASSTSIDSIAQNGNARGANWQEEAYLKIKSMKELYLRDLSDMHRKINMKIQQAETLHFPKEKIEKYKALKNIVERMILFVQLPKNQISIAHREKANPFERQIVAFLTQYCPKKPNSPQENQQQIQQSNSHQMNNPQEMNPQMHPPNLQRNTMNSLQIGSVMELSQGNTMGSFSQGPMGSLYQNIIGATQEAHSNAVAQNNININKLQVNSSNLQHQHLKQQKEQHQLLQSQQMKQQLQQRLAHQQQQQQSQKAQAHQMLQILPLSEDLKVRPQIMESFNPGISQQQQRLAHHQQLKANSQFPTTSPQFQSQSPLISQHSSPLIDQQTLLSSITKTGTPLQTVNSPCVVPSPSTSLAPLPLLEDAEKQVSGVTSLSSVGNTSRTQFTSQGQALSPAIGTPGISASPLLAEFTNLDGNVMEPGKSTVTELPMDRLLKAVKTMTTTSLSNAASDIESYINLSDRIAGSAPGNGSRVTIGENLGAMTKSRMQLNAGPQEGNSASKKMRRDTSTMPLNAVSSAGSFDALDSKSTATSIMKRAKVETSPALLDEIEETNQRLIDTVASVCNDDLDTIATEGDKGIVVKCSYKAISLGPTLKARYNSGQMSQIQPIRLLVPINYPKSSPLILDKLPVELSCIDSNNSEDLSAITRSKFQTSLRCLSQTMSLKEMVKTWDKCARDAILEYAIKHGGGNFSSRYGAWKSCAGLA